jgi:hypothetical protein
VEGNDGQDEAEQDVGGCEPYERPKGATGTQATIAVVELKTEVAGMGSKDDAAKASVRWLKDKAKVETISLMVLELKRATEGSDSMKRWTLWSRYRHRRHNGLG